MNLKEVLKSNSKNNLITYYGWNFNGDFSWIITLNYTKVVMLVLSHYFTINQLIPTIKKDIMEYLYCEA